MKLETIRRVSFGGLWMALVTLSGCWSSATVCGSDVDCFLGEICGTDNQCTPDPNYGQTPKDMTPDVTSPCPDGLVLNPITNTCVRVSNNTPDMTPDITPVMCPDGLTRCGEDCVNTSANTAFCGRCDNACQSGQVCDDGSCRTVENCADEGCAGQTFCNPNTNTCEPGCAEDVQCGDGAQCVDNACACGQGTHACGDRCADSSSPRSCGERCAPCPGGDQAACVNGQCALECPDGQRICGGACAKCPDGVRLSETVCAQTECVAKDCEDGELECGGRCIDCPGDPNGEALCGTNDQCALLCDEGFKKCGGACAKCPDGPNVLGTACSDQGACVATSCSGGAVPCDTGCCGFSDPPNGIVDAIEGGYKSSITVTPTGDVHMVYSTGLGVVSSVKHARWDGISTWVLTKIATGVAGGPKALVSDSQGNLHTAYWDASSGTVYYAINTGNGWSSSTIETNRGARYRDIAIQVDASKQPHIAYTYGSDITYVTRGSNGWIVEDVDSRITSIDQKYGADLDFLPSNGGIRLTYATDRQIIYARQQSGGNWDRNALGGTFTQPIRSRHTSLFYSSFGFPTGVYDVRDGRSVEAFVFQGQGWSQTPILQNQSVSNDYEGLGDSVIDVTDDIVHIAYINYANGETRYLRAGDNLYDDQRIDAWTQTDGTRPAVTLDSSRRAHFSYSKHVNQRPRVHYFRP